MRTRIAVLIAALSMLGLAETKAQAHWSVGIRIGVPVCFPLCCSYGPYYAPYPVYVQPAPIYVVQPAPVVYQAAPVSGQVPAPTTQPSTLPRRHS